MVYGDRNCHPVAVNLGGRRWHLPSSLLMGPIGFGVIAVSQDLLAELAISHIHEQGSLTAPARKAGRKRRKAEVEGWT